MKKADSVQVNVRIPKEWVALLSQLAQRDVRTLSSVIKHAIKEYLESHLNQSLDTPKS